jgi:hypothetical protein
MAKKKPSNAANRAGDEPQKSSADQSRLEKLVGQYEAVFAEVQHFVDMIARQDAEIAEATVVTLTARAEYDRAKANLSEIREARDGTKHTLFMFLRPGPAEILPLFDRMQPADEAKHGEGSTEWRKEPISALRLSLVATNLLTAADVIFVGQLQDRIQEAGDGWWEKIESLTAPVAAAIVDRLNDFVKEHKR